ncbi:MAG: hypothetical protein KUG74_10570 [Rhodobacteraceae bacterium]|nr:hypothetical protein [Paracoccaceae bacterium]
MIVAINDPHSGVHVFNEYGTNKFATQIAVPVEGTSIFWDRQLGEGSTITLARGITGLQVELREFDAFDLNTENPRTTRWHNFDLPDFLETCN